MTLNVERLEPGARLSQAVVAGDFVFLAGQVARDPSQHVADQTRQVLAEVDRLLAAAGSSRSRLVSVTIYLADMADFAAMNSVWDSWVPPDAKHGARHRRGAARHAGLLDYEREIGVPFTDSLTGLFTHGFFHTALDWECRRFSRQGKPFTLGLIDIDYFASYNRINGHTKGDQVLKEMVTVIKHNIMQADLAARYAGDVFALLLLDSDVDLAQVAFERIRQSVMEKYANHVTISSGLASFPRDASHKTGLVEKSQEALIQAKRMGKNKVHFFEKEKSPQDDTRASILA